jgi:hypothetical protein
MKLDTGPDAEIAPFRIEGKILESRCNAPSRPLGELAGGSHRLGCGFELFVRIARDDQAGLVPEPGQHQPEIEVGPLVIHSAAALTERVETHLESRLVDLRLIAFITEEESSHVAEVRALLKCRRAVINKQRAVRRYR